MKCPGCAKSSLTPTKLWRSLAPSLPGAAAKQRHIYYGILPDHKQGVATGYSVMETTTPCDWGGHVLALDPVDIPK